MSRYYWSQCWQARPCKFIPPPQFFFSPFFPELEKLFRCRSFHILRGVKMSRHIIVSYGVCQLSFTVIRSYLSYYLYLTFINKLWCLLDTRAAPSSPWFFIRFFNSMSRSYLLPERKCVIRSVFNTYSYQSVRY